MSDHDQRTFKCSDANFVLAVLSALYDDEVKKFAPSHFIELCCKGIHVLNKSGKDNILYYLVKDLGTPRADESGNRLPIDLLHSNLGANGERSCQSDWVVNLRYVS